MAVRTTDAQVSQVIEVDSDIDLDPFIAAANELVTEVCTNSSYTAARLAKIETWLAAAFYGVRDAQIANERAGPVGVSYRYKIGMMLAQTTQGQMAMMLDTAGNLARLSKRIEEGKSGSVGISWMGTDLDTTDDDD